MNSENSWNNQETKIENQAYTTFITNNKLESKALKQIILKSKNKA